MNKDDDRAKRWLGTELIEELYSGREISFKSKVKISWVASYLAKRMVVNNYEGPVEMINYYCPHTPDGDRNFNKLRAAWNTYTSRRGDAIKTLSVPISVQNMISLREIANILDATLANTVSWIISLASESVNNYGYLEWKKMTKKIVIANRFRDEGQKARAMESIVDRDRRSKKEVRLTNRIEVLKADRAKLKKKLSEQIKKNDQVSKLLKEANSKLKKSTQELE